MPRIGIPTRLVAVSTMPSTLTLGVLGAGEVSDRLEGDVGGEDEELDRDQLLGPLLGGLARAADAR